MVEAHKDSEPSPIPSLSEIVEMAFANFQEHDFVPEPNGTQSAYTELWASNAIVSRLTEGGISPIDLACTLGKQATTLPGEIVGIGYVESSSENWEKFFKDLTEDIVRGELVKTHHQEIKEETIRRQLLTGERLPG